jgi:hypothetical protein
MKRVDDMTSRLPLLYREGPLVQGILSQPAEQVEIAVEDALEVQRAHYFDDALELDEVARLASLLDFSPEPWQTVGLFRPWVHSQRDAVLKNGAVTAQAIVGFVQDYSSAFQQATGVVFADARPELIELPQRRRYGKPSVDDDTAPLSQFQIVTRGLDDTVASMLLTGLGAGPESMPLIANLTTGDALLFHGNVASGQRLWIRSLQDGGVTAQLERDDVTSRLVSISGLTPGTAWGKPQIQTPARALPLVRGENSFWFLPVAHYDEHGLDRFLLALADLALHEGRWDAAALDHSTFYLEPAISIRFSWLETEPASIDVHVHTESVYRREPAAGSADDARTLIAGAIDKGVTRLKAAGVRSNVSALAFSEIQGSSDFISGVLPLRLEESGTSGADRVADKAGLFGMSSYGDSTFR